MIIGRWGFYLPYLFYRGGTMENITKKYYKYITNKLKEENKDLKNQIAQLR